MSRDYPCCMLSLQRVGGCVVAVVVLPMLKRELEMEDAA